MGGGAHFIGGGGDLVDFAELHLHAFAGLARDGRRLISRATCFGDALLDLRDSRLQLVEETVEPVCQLAQFVFLGIAQALGEVTFAAGDVLEHGGDGIDWAGHAGGGQPDQKQAEQRGGRADQQGFERGGVLGLVEYPLQFQCIGQHHVFGQLDDHPPGFCIGNRFYRVHGADRVVLFADRARVTGQQLHDVFAFGAKGVDQVFADLVRLAAERCNQAGAGQNLQVCGAVKQFFLCCVRRSLQGVEGDIDADHTDDFAVDDQRQ